MKWNLKSGLKTMSGSRAVSVAVCLQRPLGVHSTGLLPVERKNICNNLYLCGVGRRSSSDSMGHPICWLDVVWKWYWEVVLPQVHKQFYKRGKDIPCLLRKLNDYCEIFSHEKYFLYN